MYFSLSQEHTRHSAPVQVRVGGTGMTHLEAASLNEGEPSLPLLRSPASAQAGVPDDCLLVESRIEVKDDLGAFDEVNLEPAGRNRNT